MNFWTCWEKECAEDMGSKLKREIAKKELWKKKKVRSSGREMTIYKAEGRVLRLKNRKRRGLDAGKWTSIVGEGETEIGG